MAAAHVVHIHQEITIRVLDKFGFTRGAQERAARANAQVDDEPGSQGRDATSTRLHAMRGFIITGLGILMQTEEQAAEAVEALLNERRGRIVDAIRQRDWPNAIDELGRALHTVQDRAYHRFEPWPFDGILDSFINPARGQQFGLAPNYMLGHLVRDLSYVSVLDFNASYNDTSGFSGFLRAGWRLPLLPNLNVIPEAAVGYDRDFGGLGWGVGVTLRLGAPPRPSPEPPERSRPSVPTAPTLGLLETSCVQADLCEAAAQGETSLTFATEESRAFVRDIRATVEQNRDGQRLWSEFTLWQP
jgi:hypothetical protein